MPSTARISPILREKTIPRVMGKYFFSDLTSTRVFGFSITSIPCRDARPVPASHLMRAVQLRDRRHLGLTFLVRVRASRREHAARQVGSFGRPTRNGYQFFARPLVEPGHRAEQANRVGMVRVLVYRADRAALHDVAG